ncbi:MAG: Snf7 family protein [Desulfurococcales archaeon]|nr:Snf7 family protein [Desulfurococcales archaeon]
MRLADWAKRWDTPARRDTVGEKVKSFINPPPPVKVQILNAIYKLSAQINKLDFSLAKLNSYDKTLFEKVVDALVQGDKAKASMYANEVAEVRKMAKTLLTIRYALERVKLRLDTALVVGDTMKQLAPAVAALKQVTGYLKGMMPDVFTELVEVEESLNIAMMQMTAVAPVQLSSDYVSGEAQAILREASLVAEQKLKQQFPEIPSIQEAPAALKDLEATVEEGK